MLLLKVTDRYGLLATGGSVFIRIRTLRPVMATMVLLVACGSAREPAARAQTGQYQTGSLDQMLAPIALYPDALLAQMLMSAADPKQITELDQFLKMTTLKGTALQDAAVKAGFDASFVALAMFPQVVTTMAQQLTWTTRLGEVFGADRTAVFNSIQKLRAQAKNVGTLQDTPQQNVEVKTTSAGQDVIVIEPTNPQVVYVPQYNTQVVYTQPPATTTVIVKEDDDDAEKAIAAGLIGFTAGVAMSSAWNNNYYYGPYGWHGGGYMYNDAWDDYYDHREDAREDWMDHREDMAGERSDRLENSSEQRSQRVENRTENRPENRQQAAQQVQQQRSERTGSTQARGYSDGTRTQAATQAQRSTTTRSSDAFSGYSSGSSQRAASSRGTTSRSSAARSSGGRSRSGGGGGRRR